MAVCRMTPMIQVFQVKTEGYSGPLSACKSSCFDGSSSLRPVALFSQRQTCSNRHLILVRAQDAKKGTRIFKFNKKQEAATDEPPEARPGTRLFRFGGPKKQDDEKEEEEDTSPVGKFGTQLFKNLGSSLKKQGASGSAKGGVLVPATKDLSFSLPRRQDPRTVFVAGATGQIGARIVQKLLREGFSVRAGVRDLFVAQQLAEFATQYGVVSREEAKQLNAVEFDFKSVESIAKAIGGAAKVVVTIGPSEDGPRSKVSFEDASNVVEAAKLANIANLVVVYEPGAGAGDENPLAGLASFFTELFSKPVAVSISDLLNQIVDSDMSYTLLKSSLTDGVDDVSPDTPNIVVRKEGTTASLESSKISKGQVASIVAEIVASPSLAENKVIEVFTSASVEATPITELLSSIPVDGRREAMAAARAQAEEEEREKALREKAEADARAAVEEARQAAQLAAELEAEAKQLTAAKAKAASMAEKAQAQAAVAAASVESLAARIKDLPGPQQLFSKAKGGDAPPAPVLPAFSLPAFPSLSMSKVKPTPSTTTSSKPSRPSPPSPSKKKQREPALSTPAAVAASAPKPQVNSIFGGLFTQETVYVDEV
ncbi:hypothetical protein GOP47_0019380 [Adiantum capillus-veneris]|uniref:NAD(P)-binding domain-containing protein n=1 Tax=Adiantum capillus-veneris TaxID=13818 RepID=A0A9D4UB74_ADICA|nr:hypothetical protein GOP47_0019380 [Adiantum capillus-veneris]